MQCDEIWSFVGAKAKNVPDDRKDEFGVGDVWMLGRDRRDSKLVPSWLLGERKTGDCIAFLDDLRDRLRYRIQLSTDAHASYKGSVGLVFGGDVDWAQIIKEYKSTKSLRAATARQPAQASASRRSSGTPTSPRPAPATSSVKTSR